VSLARIFFLLSAGLFLCCKPSDTSWGIYRANEKAQQFSSLDEINVHTIQKLELAWTYLAPGLDTRTTIECNPIIIGKTAFIISPDLQLVAIDARTGKQDWIFQAPHKSQGGVIRGVTYFEKNQLRRIFYSSGHYLYAVEAETGKLDSCFAQMGYIDLRQYLGRDSTSLSVALSTPGILFEDILIIGSATGEGYNASPGHIRAYHAVTGKFLWRFNTIPEPAEEGYDTWHFLPNENYGGANNWGGLSLDSRKGIVYVATGSPTYDFYGANRHGTNLYGNTILALDARTGKKIWHYQVVRHDIWDYDLPCAPTLTTIRRQGKQVDILIQPTKMGELIILDRSTGKPLNPTNEIDVPPSDVPGEQAWPTQASNRGILLVQQGWDSSHITNISDSAREYVHHESSRYMHHGMYTPPSLQGTITLPATRGGMLWGGLSLDPKTNIAYTNCNEIPMILALDKLTTHASTPFEKGEARYKLNCTACHGGDRKGTKEGVPDLTQINQKLSSTQIKNKIRQGKGQMPAFDQFTETELQELTIYLERADTLSLASANDSAQDKYVLKGFRIFTDAEGYPANKPPWGTLQAVDIENQQLLWSVPLGYYPKLKARGLDATGTQTFGGCVATAGGLVFIGATADERFRAFDARNGKEVWSYQLPAGGYAVPSIYAIDGKQYILIAAGGGNRNATPSGNQYLAFTLAD
jgi:quinoprotein glucose dehydrogenase